MPIRATAWPTPLRSWARFATMQLRIGDSQLHADVQDAMKNYQNASATFAALLAADPNNQGYRRRLGLTYEKIGGAQESLGDKKGALQDYLKATDLDRE